MRTTTTAQILFLAVLCGAPLLAESAPTAAMIKARIEADRAAVTLDLKTLDQVVAKLAHDDKAKVEKAVLERDRAAVAYVKAKLLADQQKLARDLEYVKLLGLTKPA